MTLRTTHFCAWHYKKTIQLKTTSLGLAWLFTQWAQFYVVVWAVLGSFIRHASIALVHLSTSSVRTTYRPDKILSNTGKIIEQSVCSSTVVWEIIFKIKISHHHNKHRNDIPDRSGHSSSFIWCNTNKNVRKHVFWVSRKVKVLPRGIGSQKTSLAF